MKNIFCPAPWIQISSSSDGRPKYCYGANDSNHTSFSDFWFSNKLENIRQEFSKGNYISGCARCIKEKNLNLNNRQDKFFKIVENNKENFEELFNNWKAGVKIYPEELNLRFSNICNLKCRMCNSGSSNLFRKEVIKNKELMEFYPTGGNKPATINNKDLKLFLPNVKRVAITGGEPLVNNEFYKFIDLCIETNTAKNIYLRITTNGTTIPDMLIEKLKQFKNVKILISLDGIENVYEYIRFPNKWSNIDLNKFATLSNSFDLYVDYTLQVYNYLHINKFTNYFNNMGINISYTPVYEPSWFNVNILPLEEKEKIRKFKLPMIQNFITLTDYNLNEINKFKKITDIFDKIRKQNFKNELPELYEIISRIK